MNENPLRRLQSFGQSVWLDFIRRGMLTHGDLQRLIDEDGLSGVTANPSIFEKAIAESHDYDDAIRALALEDRNVPDLYQTLAVEDVQRAADLFRPIYDRTQGRDGYVSLEVSPYLAADTTGTIAEARRLWAALDRPNVFIKVPATPQGVPAIQQLIGEGINVNVTLLFALSRYREVAEAYLAGLEVRAAVGQPLERVASVASFFLSRIDVVVDPVLEQAMHMGDPRGEVAARLHGKAAISSARVAYQMYKEIFGGERFRKLVERGARSQRLLWASTGTKNPLYSDVLYVEALIGPETINTLPQATLNAYRDHGRSAARLEEGLAEAQQVLQRLPEVGVNLAEVTRRLEEEGVRKFIVAFDKLLAVLESERKAALGEPVDRQTFTLGACWDTVEQRLDSLERDNISMRLWRKDASLWTEDAARQAVIRNALGWLDIAEDMEEHIDRLTAFAAEMRVAGFRQVVYLGVGGGSSAARVFSRTFSPSPGGLPLMVLDTTDPSTILSIEQVAPLAHTLFLVAGKSDAAIELLALSDYFYSRLQAIKGDRAGDNFIAITDPGSALVQQARERRFRSVFLNPPDISELYAALSWFGLLPAALLGVDVSELLIRALRMRHACDACVPVRDAPGLVLGAILGELARQGRNKVTFLASRPIAPVAGWLEQLLAESTGKEGKGLLAVVNEPAGTSLCYGDDRLFVFLREKESLGDDPLDISVSGLQETGHPVVIIQLDDRLDLGQEFFRWEIATAVAGSILGIDAFDQPNVQESEGSINQLLQLVAEGGRLPEGTPALSEGPLAYYSRYAAENGAEMLSRFLDQGSPGDYIALLAYLTQTVESDQALQAIRIRLRDRLRLATILRYGPRYLRSTGQLHKGGPHTGLFLQLTADDPQDIAIPGRPYTFGILKRTQALGEFQALEKHHQHVLRIHLGADQKQGLAALIQAMERALARR